VASIDLRLGFEAFRIAKILAALRTKDESLAPSALDIWYELMKWNAERLSHLKEVLSGMLTRHGIDV